MLHKSKFRFIAGISNITIENNNDLVLSEENEDSKQEVNSNISITIEKIRHKQTIIRLLITKNEKIRDKQKMIWMKSISADDQHFIINWPPIYRSSSDANVSCT